MTVYRAQSLARGSLPHKGWVRPDVVWYVFATTFIVTSVGEHTVLVPGSRSITTFLISYTVVGMLPLLCDYWKLLKRTKKLKSEEV